MKHFFTTRVRVVLIVAVLLAVGLTVISELTTVGIDSVVISRGIGVSIILLY